MNKSDLVGIRDIVPGDEAFILSTWLKGLLYGYGDEGFYRKIPSDIYFLNHHRVLTSILGASITKIKIACLKDDPDVILGYSVCRQVNDLIILDWAFTKKSWREIGICRSLLPDGINTVTNLTRVGESILKKHPTITFNPYL